MALHRQAAFKFGNIQQGSSIREKWLSVHQRAHPFGVQEQNLLTSCRLYSGLMPSMLEQVMQLYDIGSWQDVAAADTRVPGLLSNFVLISQLDEESGETSVRLSRMMKVYGHIFFALNGFF